MNSYFDICGTHIPMESIRDFRVIKVEFVYRPVFRECSKTLASAFSSKKYEFACMEPYAAVIGQQGQKSALGEYKPKTFKEALGKDISGAVIYTIADALKLKAFKRPKYQFESISGRAFTAYLDDIPAKMIWANGRAAEVYKEDKLHAQLNEITNPGINYINTLVIKAHEKFCFYGNSIQIADANHEFERLTQEMESYAQSKRANKSNNSKNVLLSAIPNFLAQKKSKNS